MVEHEGVKKDKKGDEDRRHRSKQQDSKPLFDQSLAWDTGPSSLTETPFYPRMEEHAAMLSSIPFAVQRNNFIMQLHQTYGNRYVQRLMESIDVQAKLTVSEPGDIYEQEADRVADAVTRTMKSKIRRQEEEEEEEIQAKPVLQLQNIPEEEELQTKPISSIQQQTEEEEELQVQPVKSQATAVSDGLETRINNARGSGQSLSDDIREPMEQAFGADFSGVRVHTDSEADLLNEQLSAKAFTTARDIFFRQGEYSPGSDSGQKLLAHELTHVVQQNGAQLQRQAQTPNTSPPIRTVTVSTSTIQRDLPTRAEIEGKGGAPEKVGVFATNHYLRILKALEAYENATTRKAKEALLDKISENYQDWVKKYATVNQGRRKVLMELMENVQRERALVDPQRSPYTGEPYYNSTYRNLRKELVKDLKLEDEDYYSGDEKGKIESLFDVFIERPFEYTMIKGGFGHWVGKQGDCATLCEAFMTIAEQEFGIGLKTGRCTTPFLTAGGATIDKQSVGNCDEGQNWFFQNHYWVDFGKDYDLLFGRKEVKQDQWDEQIERGTLITEDGKPTKIDYRITKKGKVVWENDPGKAGGRVKNKWRSDDLKDPQKLKESGYKIPSKKGSKKQTSKAQRGSI